MIGSYSYHGAKVLDCARRRALRVPQRSLPYGRKAATGSGARTSEQVRGRALRLPSRVWMHRRLRQQHQQCRRRPRAGRLHPAISASSGACRAVCDPCTSHGSPWNRRIVQIRPLEPLRRGDEGRLESAHVPDRQTRTAPGVRIVPQARAVHGRGTRRVRVPGLHESGRRAYSIATAIPRRSSSSPGERRHYGGISVAVPGPGRHLHKERVWITSGCAILK